MIFDFAFGSLNESLRYFEILHASDLHRTQERRYRRSAFSQEFVMSFSALGRKFSVHLTRDQSILAPNFTVEVVNDDRIQTVDVDLNFYRGFLEDDASSLVTSHFTEDGLWSATIRTDVDLYFVEPSWPHLPNSSRYSMIAYRLSDMLPFDRRMLCGVPRDQSADLQQHTQHPFTSHRRRRAAGGGDCSTSRNTCELLLVADEQFFKEVGSGSVPQTVRLLVDVVYNVDEIYRRTHFGCFSNYGFAVLKVKVNVKSHTHLHCCNDYLAEFSKDEMSELEKHCLGHLFTYQPFVDPPGSRSYVYGLAYIGSPHYGVGVCHSGGGNVGWTTYRGRHGRLLQTQATLVTAHELGHNWGSPHDPTGDECAPDADHGGKYIMYWVSVSGQDANNEVFSPCSRRAIFNTLQVRSEYCFREKVTVFCGNHKVEGGEQCDAGTGDKCCSATCQHNPGAECSAVYDECCTSDCRFKQSKEKCRNAANCAEEATCTGHSKDCPASRHKADGTPCEDKIGQCKDGKCTSLCKIKNYQPCSCDADDIDKPELCQLCCIQGGTCKPLVQPPTNAPMTLAEGMSCKYGACQQGKCIEQSLRLVRTWELVDIMSLAGAVMFMKTNIATTIVVVSLLVYVPVAYFAVARRDRVRRAQRGGGDKEAENGGPSRPVSAPPKLERLTPLRRILGFSKHAWDAQTAPATSPRPTTSNAGF